MKLKIKTWSVNKVIDKVANQVIKEATQTVIIRTRYKVTNEFTSDLYNPVIFQGYEDSEYETIKD